MKFVGKILLVLLIFVIVLPSVQSSNVFQDIKSINRGMKDANEKLETIKKDINDLLESINGTNEILDDVKESAALLDDIDGELEEMSDQLEDVSSKASTAIDMAEKVEGYFGTLMIVILVGISILAIAVISLIAATILILKKRK